MKTILNILGWWCLCSVLLSLGFLAGWVAQVMLHKNTPPKLPTIREIQKQIGCTKIDGIWGPETNKLYDRAICNQFAIKTFKEAGE